MRKDSFNEIISSKDGRVEWLLALSEVYKRVVAAQESIASLGFFFNEEERNDTEFLNELFCTISKGVSLIEQEKENRLNEFKK